MLAILLLAVVVPCVYSLGVIAPLYYNPRGDCSRWSSISSAISDNSGTPFYLVINPDDGPGPAGSQPDSSYDLCVPRLRPSSNPNAIVLGYVDVSSKSASSILAEVDTYAGWNSSSRPTGIFFDGTSASSSSRYQSFVSRAKNKGFNFIAMDPGEPASSDYYSLADLVNTYESSYSDFRTADLIISSSAPASKQSVILSKAPVISSYSAVISQLASLGVAAVYITDLANDVSGIPQQWSAFINDVASVGGVSSASNPTNTPSSFGITSQSPSGASASSTTSTSSPEPTSGATSKSSSSVGAMVGGVLGAVILILLGLFFILWRRRRQSSQTAEAPLDPFLPRQPFTLIQTAQKHPTDSQHTMLDTEAGTSLPAPTGSTYVSSSSAPSQSSASNYGGGGRGTSEKRRPSVTATSNRATIASARTRISANGTLHRYSFDPPPSYRAPSPAPI